MCWYARNDRTGHRSCTNSMKPMSESPRYAFVRSAFAEPLIATSRNEGKRNLVAVTGRLSVPVLQKCLGDECGVVGRDLLVDEERDGEAGEVTGIAGPIGHPPDAEERHPVYVRDPLRRCGFLIDRVDARGRGPNE